MKLAHIALAAVLIVPCAAQAATVTDPGPHKVPRNQYACMNLMDADDLNGTTISKDVRKERAMWEILSRPENAPQKRQCVGLRKGTTVTVQKKTAAYECVEVKGRPAEFCFWTRSVSGTTTAANEPVYDGLIFLH